MKKITIYRESAVEWMKLRFKPMTQNIRKQKTTNQNEKKKNKLQKKMRIVLGACGTPSSIPTFTSWGCQKNRKSKKLHICLTK